MRRTPPVLLALLVNVLIACSTAADPPHRWCPPPAVYSYQYCPDGSCAALGQFIARGFESFDEAVAKLIELRPEQRYSAQLVTFTRSHRFALVWRGTREEVDEYRANYPVKVAVAEHPAPRDGESPENWAANLFRTNYWLGYDVAIVSSNDPDRQFLVVTQLGGDCATEAPPRKRGGDPID